MKIEITENMVKNANAYIPVMEKEKLAAIIAENAVEPVKVQIDGLASGVKAVPDIYRENISIKARYLMGVLATRYLGCEINIIDGDETKSFMDAYEYDLWGRSHVYDQLERMKRGGVATEIRDKVYEILSDFRDVERRVNAAIHSLIDIQNDTCVRLLIMVENMTTPEALQATTQELEKTRDDLKAYADSKKKGKSNG